MILAQSNLFPEATATPSELSRKLTEEYTDKAQEIASTAPPQVWRFLVEHSASLWHYDRRVAFAVRLLLLLLGFGVGALYNKQLGIVLAFAFNSYEISLTAIAYLLVSVGALLGFCLVAVAFVTSIRLLLFRAIPWIKGGRRTLNR